ncbi:MAG: hypothetical protein COW30_15750 [Rhodospirillales bacterium CG15_BIG_FIL_POST_REV_8_21_14_020_66_15]|nr:MAG: hypothetical protein COW30_15750 [Rhodospirillales bacterium CG15_BIG_FIL_POST_REV_8_21_14_020_66_15]
MRKSFVVPAVVAAMTLVACGEKEPSKLTFDQVAQELAKGGDSFKGYLKGLDNKLVKWSGAVTETRKWHEDDYAPAAGMLVDMDGTPGPELFVNIGVDDLKTIKAGSKVTFTALLTDSADEQGKALIKLKVEKFH